MQVVPLKLSELYFVLISIFHICCNHSLPSLKGWRCGAKVGEWGGAYEHMIYQCTSHFNMFANLFITFSEKKQSVLWANSCDCVCYFTTTFFIRRK